LFHALWCPDCAVGFDELAIGGGGLLGLIFGLGGGILALKRKAFSLAIICMAILTLAGISMFVVPKFGVVFGLPILVLTILSITFISKSEREFT